MITSVRDIKSKLKGLKANTLIEISDSGLTIVRACKLAERRVNAKDVFLLLDIGYSQSDTAKQLEISRQLVHWLSRQREDILNAFDKESEG